jgi:hypothetical protein
MYEDQVNGGDLDEYIAACAALGIKAMIDL